MDKLLEVMNDIIMYKGIIEATGSATVNFMRNFRALSKSVEFHPCASAQGRDGKEDEGVRGGE